MQRPRSFGNRLVGVQLDLFVVDCFPWPLDENVVPPAALAVHADADVMRLEQAGELEAGELAALIRVENLGPPVAGDGFFDRLDTGIRRHVVRT